MSRSNRLFGGNAYCWVVVGGCLLLGLGGLYLFSPFAPALAISLIVGWFSYLRRVLPQITFNWEMITCGIVALGIAAWLLHGFLKWGWRFWKPLNAKSDWRPAWTFSGAALLLLLFVNATALTGIFHQIGWLFGANSLMVDTSIAMDTAAGGKAMGIHLGIMNYASDHDGKFPERLEQLVPDYVTDSSAFLYKVVTLDGSKTRFEDFRYIKGFAQTSSPSAIVLYTPIPAHRRFVTVRVNGRVEHLSEEKFEVALWKTEKNMLLQQARR